MPLNLLIDVFGACGAPIWSVNNDAVDLVVEKDFISFDTLRKLETGGIYPERLADPTNPKIQADYNSNASGVLPPKASFKLRLPRIVSECVVAKNLADLLTISSATYCTPKTYFLVGVEDSKQPFCFIGQSSLSNASSLIKRYHNAVKLWELLKSQAEHLTAAHGMLFFGIRRIEITPRFCVGDLAEEIAFDEISAFLANNDQEKTRKEIFHSVLSEFLRDQKPDRAFAYVLLASGLLAQRLKEGLAIFLSNHSPEKLAKEAKARHLELAEKLEKIISGMEAKSLSIPAAVLFAVKEAEFGSGWTTLNVVILISTTLYLVTMGIAYLSQKAMLNLLETMMCNTVKELKDQGLDEKNTILSESFAKLEGHEFIRN